MQAKQRIVDHSALRVTAASTMSLLILAFVLNAWWLAALVAAANFIAALVPPLGLFRGFYLRVLKPLGIVRPAPEMDNPEPHRFAQGLGAVFTGAGVIALLAGVPPLGWALVWLVIGLAALNLFLGFCAGCFVYYQLNRLGVPGFRTGKLERSRS